MRQKFIFSILNILMLSVVIATASIFFIENTNWIGVVLIILAILCIFSLVPFKISLKSIQPDIIFGMIDNGILAVNGNFWRSYCRRGWSNYWWGGWQCYNRWHCRNF